MDEIPLMEIVELIQEELHGPCLFGENQPALLLRDDIAVPKLLESAFRYWIALNIPQCKRHAGPPHTIHNFPANLLETKWRQQGRWPYSAPVAVLGQQSPA